MENKEILFSYITCNGSKPKFIAVDAVVDDYFRRHEIALQKAKIISPAIAPVSLQF